MTGVPKYRRVLLKVSGEALMGDSGYGIDVAVVDRIAADVKDATRAGSQVCMVIGGGNIFRGLQGAAKGIDRATADYMGMLATVMNALAMQATLERMEVPARVQSAMAPMSRSITSSTILHPRWMPLQGGSASSPMAFRGCS